MNIDNSRNSISIQVGRKIKDFRLLRNLTQTQLGERVGLSYTQIQRYENGSNQALVNKLCEIAEALSIDVLSFFSDMYIEQKTFGMQKMKIY